MAITDLDQRAALTLWPSPDPGTPAASREFPTLREAIQAASAVLADPEARPWIVIEDGTILRPGWIREKARALGFVS